MVLRDRSQVVVVVVRFFPLILLIEVALRLLQDTAAEGGPRKEVMVIWVLYVFISGGQINKLKKKRQLTVCLLRGLSGALKSFVMQIQLYGHLRLQ